MMMFRYIQYLCTFIDLIKLEVLAKYFANMMKHTNVAYCLGNLTVFISLKLYKLLYHESAVRLTIMSGTVFCLTISWKLFVNVYRFLGLVIKM